MISLSIAFYASHLFATSRNNEGIIFIKVASCVREVHMRTMNIETTVN
jgi:hypothetical protein